jgi:hypothetical protein
MDASGSLTLTAAIRAAQTEEAERVRPHVGDEARADAVGFRRSTKARSSTPSAPRCSTVVESGEQPGILTLASAQCSKAWSTRVTRAPVRSCRVRAATALGVETLRGPRLGG